MSGRRLVAAAALVLLSACSSHGLRHGPVPAADLARERRDAGMAYVQGDLARATSLYAALTDALPDDADLWFRLGNAQFRRQRMDEAVASYEHAVRIRPDHARALYNLGVVRLKQAQAAMLASAQAGLPGDAMRIDSGRIAQRLARVGDDAPPRAKGDGGAPPFIIDSD